MAAQMQLAPAMKRRLAKWPDLADADVKIIITGSRQYNLHSNILKEVSPVMAQLLSDENTAKLSSKAVKKGVTIRNRLQAVKNPYPDDSENAPDTILVPLEVDSEGKSIERIPLDLENGMIVHEMYIAYDLVLGSFYGKPIDFGGLIEDDLAGMVRVALSVLGVAEYLEVVDTIRQPIEAALLSIGQILQRSISNNPPAWLDFGHRTRSFAIFREAMIHATGKYNDPMVQHAMWQTMQQPIGELLEQKGTQLMHNLKEAQKNIISYYPAPLLRELAVGLVDKDKNSRSSYGNDILTWIALNVFRHYVTQNAVDDQTHRADDMGFEFFSAIAKGGDHYLAKKNLDDFHKYFPMSVKGDAVVEAKLAEIKEHVKRFVHGFFKNESQLDISTYPVQHFTCARIDYEEYPWVKLQKIADAQLGTYLDEDGNRWDIESV